MPDLLTTGLAFSAIGIIIIFIVSVASELSKNESFSSEQIAAQNINRHGSRCYEENISNAEREVIAELENGLNCDDYYIFNNLILPLANGSSTQIDHVVVSRYGVFVIESKNYQGWIFGDAYGKVWTQCLPKGYKFTFQNPIHQNFAHVKALAAILPFIQSNIYNLVVFSETCEFKTPRIKYVLYLSELVEYIKRWKAPIINEQNLYLIIGKLSYLCQAVSITNDDHVNNLNHQLSKRNHR